MICHHCKQPISTNEAFVRIPPAFYDVCEYLHLTCYEQRQELRIKDEDEWSM